MEQSSKSGWETYVRAPEPYVPGKRPEHSGIIKLNTNENPYPPGPETAAALAALDAGALRLYPDSACSSLLSALSGLYGIDEDRIILGVGSDDVLALAFLTFFHSERPLLLPDITYSFYRVWADVFRVPVSCIPIKEDHTIDPNDYCRENGGIIIANPNAPTARAMSIDEIEFIAASNPDSVVIIDEAYVDFGAVSALPLTDRYENLLVVRTFSKSRALAGMRIGYAFGSEKLISYMRNVKYSVNSYALNYPALAVGEAAVKDEAYFQDTIGKLVRTRERVTPLFRELGFKLHDSKANFLFMHHPDIPGKELFNALEKNGIYVRRFDDPRIKEYLRITVGTDKEMDTLLDFLARY